MPAFRLLQPHHCSKQSRSQVHSRRHGGPTACLHAHVRFVLNFPYFPSGRRTHTTQLCLQVCTADQCPCISVHNAPNFYPPLHCKLPIQVQKRQPRCTCVVGATVTRQRQRGVNEPPQSRMGFSVQLEWRGSHSPTSSARLQYSTAIANVLAPIWGRGPVGPMTT